MQQAAPEGTESGTVTQVLQKGYTYKGKVVRHASVAVAEWAAPPGCNQSIENFSILFSRKFIISTQTDLRKRE